MHCRQGLEEEMKAGRDMIISGGRGWFITYQFAETEVEFA